MAVAFILRDHNLNRIPRKVVYCSWNGSVVRGKRGYKLTCIPASNPIKGHKEIRMIVFLLMNNKLEWVSGLGSLFGGKRRKRSPQRRKRSPQSQQAL